MKKGKTAKKYLTGQGLLRIILDVARPKGTLTGRCIWGYSSAGRALEWHSRGQRFDPAYLHQTKKRTSAIVGGGAFYLSGRIYLRVLYFAARFLRLLNRAFK